MELLTLFLLFLLLLVQFSAVIIPALTVLYSSEIGLAGGTILWFISLILAITIAYFAGLEISKVSVRFSEYFKRKRIDFEEKYGSAASFTGLVLLCFTLWVYLSVPLMALMGVKRRKVYAAGVVGNCLFYFIIASSILGFLRFTSNLYFVVVLSLVVMLIISFLANKLIRKWKVKKG